MNGLLAALIKILVILIVVAVHAYFVATEYSVVTRMAASFISRPETRMRASEPSLPFLTISTLS